MNKSILKAVEIESAAVLTLIVQILWYGPEVQIFGYCGIKAIAIVATVSAVLIVSMRLLVILSGFLDLEGISKRISKEVSSYIAIGAMVILIASSLAMAIFSGEDVLDFIKHYKTFLAVFLVISIIALLTLGLPGAIFTLILLSIWYIWIISIVYIATWPFVIWTLSVAAVKWREYIGS